MLFSFITKSVDIGSDTAVTRFNMQVTVNNTDRIAGFAGLNAGFELFDSNVTASFDSFFFVAGDIQLNGGTLNLNQDLILQEMSNLVSLGNINGNYHQVQLAPNVQTIPSGDIIDCNLELVTQTADLGPNIRSMDWAFDNIYLAVGMQSGAGDDLRIFEFINNQTLTQVSSAALDNTIVNAVKWHPRKYLLALGRDTPGAVGSELIVYSFNTISNTLSVVDTDTFAADVDAVDWHPTGDYLAVTSELSTNELRVYPVGNSGILDKANALNLNLSPKIPGQNALDWDLTGTFVALGTTGAGGGSELYIAEFQEFPSLSLTLNASANAGTLQGISWNKNSLYQDILATGGSASPELRLWQHNGGLGTVTQIFGLATANTFAVRFNPLGSCLAVGTVSDASLGEFRNYVYNPVAQTLALIDDFEFGTTIRALSWSLAGNFIAQGGNNDFVSVYKTATAFEPFIFSNIRLFLNNDVVLRDCAITFTGSNILNGRGNSLRFDGDCSIRVAQNSGLLIQDIRIENIHEGGIVGLDATSSFSFKDVRWIMDSNYTFSKGSFEVLQNFSIEGPGYVFIYESDQVSKITEFGHMIIDTDTTFSYNPDINSNTLLQYTHSSSQLTLNSSTLAVSAAGLRLTQGTLNIEGKSFMNNTGAFLSEGIFFGDGINAANNLNIEFKPAATLEILNGFLTNDNV